MTNDNGELKARPDSEFTERELFLMKAGFDAGGFYSSFDIWLEETIDDMGHTVQQHLIYDANRLTRPDSVDDGLIGRLITRAKDKRHAAACYAKGPKREIYLKDAEIMEQAITALSQASGSGVTARAKESDDSFAQYLAECERTIMLATVYTHEDTMEFIRNLRVAYDKFQPAKPKHIEHCDNDGCVKINSGIDACIKPLVDALNEAGFKTVASCCGHRNRMGSIVMDNKVELLITDFDTAREIEKHFADIHGEREPAKPKAEDVVATALEEADRFLAKFVPNGSSNFEDGAEHREDVSVVCQLVKAIKALGGGNE